MSADLVLEKGPEGKEVGKSQMLNPSVDRGKKKSKDKDYKQYKNK